MNILVCNDDGIDVHGIKKLAEIACKLGDVYVVAPNGQRSAVSHGITIGKEIPVWSVPFDAPVKEAFSVEGTPADCVRVGVNCLLSVRPDIILSGINYGYNLGFDTLYSGTVGAAREGNSYGIKAFAISMEQGADDSIVDAHLLTLLKELMDKEINEGELWNINIPDCSLEEVKGIKMCELATHSNYSESFEKIKISEREYKVKVKGELRKDSRENTDIRAIADNYISVSKIKSFY